MAEAAVVGIGLQAIGQDKASRAQGRALRSEAAQARKNAKNAKLNAEFEAAEQQIQTRKILGQQKAGFAVAGVEGGSVFAVMADSMANAEMDRLSILFGGDLRAEGFVSESESKIRGARDARSAGLFALVSGGLRAGGAAAAL